MFCKTDIHNELNTEKSLKKLAEKGAKPTKNDSSLKVKEFLASRIDQDDQTTEKEYEFLTEKDEDKGEQEEKNAADNNWVTLEAEDGQSFEVQEDEGGFPLPDTFLSPPLGDILVANFFCLVKTLKVCAWIGVKKN